MRQFLNYDWLFAKTDSKDLLNSITEKKKVNIPHNAVDVPYNYFSEQDYQGIFLYEKSFDVDYYDDNKLYFLTFEGFMLKASIFLNNNYLGEYVSGYLPVKIDVSKVLKEKSNKLVVILDSHEDENYPPFGFAIDYLTFSGIYREVYLESRPKTYLDNLYVHGDTKGRINVTYEVKGNCDYSISHELYFYNKLVLTSNLDVFSIENAELWDIDNPNLYTLKTILNSQDGVDKVITRFGFKESKFQKDGFYLNGKKIKLLGLNRHQSYPFVGYAMPKSMQIEDADILKYELGCNVVRTSHYPQSRHFLDRCDEIGLLVVNEIPGWQHIGKSETWITQYYKNVEAMVINQRNHASLIAHGVRIDESIDNHELYKKGNEIAHNLDKYHQTIGVRNFKHSELLEDVYGYNDFICNSLKVGVSYPKHLTKRKAPILITEYMGHMHPLKATSDEQSKIDVALQHAKVINDGLKYNRISGTIGWCFVDYQTHVDFGSGDHICPHGVYDLYRNPKYSSYVYSSQQDNFPVMQVISNMKPGDFNEATFKDIYVLTNCDYVELYKNGEFVKRFYPLSNKTFGSLKHPPILIDDIVGETFNEPLIKKKSWPRIAKMLSYTAINGFNALKLRHKIYLAYMMLKYKGKLEITEMWNNYIGSWGGKAKVYTFKGFKNNKLVKVQKLGPSTKFDLAIAYKKTVLENKATYDVSRLVIKYVDEHQSVMSYANKIIHIDTEGPIEVIGGSNQVMLGGQLSLFIKSKNELGKAKIKITCEAITKEIELEVK